MRAVEEQAPCQSLEPPSAIREREHAAPPDTACGRAAVSAAGACEEVRRLEHVIAFDVGERPLRGDADVDPKEDQLLPLHRDFAASGRFGAIEQVAATAVEHRRNIDETAEPEGDDVEELREIETNLGVGEQLRSPD